MISRVSLLPALNDLPYMAPVQTPCGTQDPDISAEDKAQAMHELQGMFNSAGRLGKGDKISKRELMDGALGSKGVTTTGASSQEGSGGEQSVPLLPRPSPRRQQ
eukprot:scaffold292191_cov21-Tisochrysis_lutea.AAC.1